MAKSIVLFMLSFFAITGFNFAQTDSIFYKDIYLSKQCSASKANYVSLITTNPDGQTIKEIKQIKGNITLQKELSTGEQIGIWHYRNNRILDFDFHLNYTDTACNEATLVIDKPFTDNIAINYQAPLFESAYKSVNDFLSGNIVYPEYAKENGISGKAVVHFVITSTGTIQDIAVVGSGDVSLDKEAVRVIKLIKLVSPPKIDGKATTICASFPVIFMIQN